MEVNDVKVLKTSSDSFKNRIEDDALFIDKTLLIHEIIRKKRKCKYSLVLEDLGKQRIYQC